MNVMRAYPCPCPCLRGARLRNLTLLKDYLMVFPLKVALLYADAPYACDVSVVFFSLESVVGAARTLNSSF
jgi:hypothetical protein